MQLKRADVVTGALALLDADGLDGLTMRKLGVQAGGIYWHFKNKQALLEAMADRIVGEVTRRGAAADRWCLRRSGAGVGGWCHVGEAAITSTSSASTSAC
jgi:TetR/AcrR family transcriptional regulator, tetracycline repressor protein